MKTRIADRLDFYGPAVREKMPVVTEQLLELAEAFHEYAVRVEASARELQQVLEEGRGGHDSDDPIRYPTLHHRGV